MVFEAPGWRVNEAWRRFCYEHDEILSYGIPNEIDIGEERLLQQWCCPPERKIKLNVDGSFMLANLCMGGRGILRASKGSWVVGFHSHGDGGNALVTEATTLREGLDLAWNKGCRFILCEVDCKDLLQALEDDESMRFLPVLQEVQERLQNQWFMELSWIPRDCNKVADWLAHQGVMIDLSGVRIFDQK
ncbi:uncharacterized protein LOC130747639 [Lotus japonicus]|uniref:uncharacterized protein LOC130747639 n=1 Tax=Lotus japonicus TaxID=34305 RepID=UPI00258D53E1|nr:uncharacterized protein LOC130747639 [Lotus japonicus]